LPEKVSVFNVDAFVKSIQMAELKVPPIPYNMARRSDFSDKKLYM
jgi:hypothetical protein